jgi:hypothetical protein
MGVTANQYRVHDRGRKNVFVGLRQKCEMLRDGLAMRGKNIFAQRTDGAGLGRSQSSQRHQRQGFARAVLTKNSDKLTAPQGQVKAIDQQPAWHGYAKIFAGQKVPGCIRPVASEALVIRQD